MIRIEGPVAVSGDWHSDQDYGAEIVKHFSDRTKAFIHVGDFGYFDPDDMVRVSMALQKVGAKMYWIDGNHENHARINSLERDSEGLAEIHPNLYHVRRGAFIEVDGHTWLLNGGASSVDRLWRKSGIDWWPEELVQWGQIREVPDTKVSVLVTHETPYITEVLLEIKDSPDNPWPLQDLEIAESQVALLENLVLANRPEHVYHGHWHVRYDEVVDYRDFVVNFHGLDREGSAYKNNTVLVSGSGDIVG